MKLLIAAVCACLLTACTAVPNHSAKPDYRFATVEVINAAKTQ